MIDKTRRVRLIFMNIRFHKRQHKRNVKCEDDSLSRPKNKGNGRNCTCAINFFAINIYNITVFIIMKS